MVDNSQHSSFLGRASLDVGYYICREKALGSGCNAKMKRMNMVTCIICTVCDRGGARRKRSWYIIDFEISETQGCGVVLCEIVVWKLKSWLMIIEYYFNFNTFTSFLVFALYPFIT